MADAKRRHDYDIAIVQTKFISDMFAGEFDPIKCNPYRLPEVAKVPQTKKRRQKEADNGIKALGMYLKQMKKPKKKK